MSIALCYFQVDGMQRLSSYTKHHFELGEVEFFACLLLIIVLIDLFSVFKRKIIPKDYPV